jgi:hypothetical protein
LCALFGEQNEVAAMSCRSFAPAARPAEIAGVSNAPRLPIVRQAGAAKPARASVAA